MHLLALDLGGTKLATALFHQDGRLLHKNVVPLAMRIGSQVGELVQHEIKEPARIPPGSKTVSVPI